MSRIGKGFMAAIALFWAHGATAQLADGLYAQFETSMGSFTCRLDYVEAPLTCANFAGLIEGSQSWLDIRDGRVRSDPYYDGLIFHRVMDGFVIQGGDPLGTGGGGPGYAFPDELVPSSDDYATAGTLVMANSGIDSNGSQIFITVVPYPRFDDYRKYMVFGKVVDGLDVVLNIGAVATDAGDRPLTDVVMNQVRILRIGTEAANFDPASQPLPEVMPLHLSITNGISGMEVGYSISNQCEQSIYSSTNLFNWDFEEKQYWFSESGPGSLATATNRPTEFFRAARVFYPQAVPGLSPDITGHQLEFTQGANHIVLNPQAGGVGTCTFFGTPDTIIGWWWTPEIRSASIEVHTAGGGYWAFQIYRGVPDNGNWNGYQYYNDTWNPVGEWSYTDTPPAP